MFVRRQRRGGGRRRRAAAGGGGGAYAPGRPNAGVHQRARRILCTRNAAQAAAPARRAAATGAWRAHAAPPCLGGRRRRRGTRARTREPVRHRASLTNKSHDLQSECRARAHGGAGRRAAVAAADRTVMLREQTYPLALPFFFLPFLAGAPPPLFSKANALKFDDISDECRICRSQAATIGV